MTPLTVIYEATKDQLPPGTSLYKFGQTMISRGWRFESIDENSALMIKDNYIHVGALPDGRGKFITRKRIKEVFEPFLRFYGSIRTEVSLSMESSQKFVERLGFKKVDFDYLTNMITYEMKEIPYARRTTVHRSSNCSRWSC